MATSAQITANQINAQSSTGPRTTEGKAASSQNARRHGLTAKTLVLSGEDQAAFDQLRSDLTADYGPKGDLEQALLDALVEATWRLLRLRRAETAFHEQCIKQLRKDHPELDYDAAFAMMFLDPRAASQLRLFLRYQAPIERAWRDADKRLMSVIAARRQLDANRAVAERVRNLGLELPSTGFVSQSPQPARTIRPRPLNARRQNLNAAAVRL